MKIYGVSMVRDEADIIALSVRHHLALGLDRVIVVDNGSRDETADVLERLNSDSRFSWRRMETDGHRQAEIFTALAEEAHRDGADWLLPFDADEFWDTRGARLRDILHDCDAGALRAPLVNFVQARDRVDDNNTCSLATMNHRTKPHGHGIEQNRTLVENGEIAYVEAHQYPKMLTRLSPQTRIGMGNHTVSTAAGVSQRTQAMRVLHAPLHSRSCLPRKAENGRRVARLYADPDIGWHSKRFARLEAEGFLDREWLANSQHDGQLDLPGGRSPVLRDDSLVNAVAEWL